MITSTESAILLFESLTDTEKGRVLGRVCHYLTVVARAVCTEGTPEQQRENLIAINEIQHKALGQMLAYQSGRKDRYSDRAVFLALVDLAKKADLLGYLQRALAKALEGGWGSLSS
ncbi:MAG TPA: hypothetical protein VGI46_08475 [Candidatus Acidoferrum sp.]|jgi:hypothetical protein